MPEGGESLEFFPIGAGESIGEVFRFGCLAIFIFEAPDARVHVVAEKVVTIEGFNGASVDVTAIDGLALVVFSSVRVFKDRFNEVILFCSAHSFFRSFVGGLPISPSEVSSLELGGGDDVDFFPSILADIGDVEVVSVPAAAPRVSYSVGEDFWVFAVEEGIVGGNRIAFVVGDIDTEYFTEQAF